MIAVTGALLDLTPFYGAVAHVAGAVYVWATHRSEPRSAELELTDMLRRPVRWTARHPLQAGVRLVRKMDRRKAS